MQTEHVYTDGRGRYPDQIGFKAPRDLRSRAQRLAEREGVSLAEFLRRAIERSLQDAAGAAR